MDFGTLLLLLALVVLVGAFIARPLWGGRVSSRLEINIEHSELLAERERVLDALAELDLDNEMGKVPDALYPMQRDALVKRGAAVLRLLDESNLAAKEDVYDLPKIEYDQDDPLETMIAAKRISKSTKIATNDTKSNYCANCGAKLQSGDKFCPDCGLKL